MSTNKDYKHNNLYMMSFIKVGCFYLYGYDDSQILTEIHSKDDYEDGFEAKDVCIIKDGVESIVMMMDSWEIAKVAYLNNVELINYFPNRESALKAYAEYFI